MNQIDENLKNPMLVHHHRRHIRVLAHHFNSVAGKTGQVDLQRIIHETGDGHRLDESGNAGIVLLHGHDFLYVLHVAGHLILLLLQEGMFALELARKLNEKTWNQFAFGVVAEKRSEVSLMLPERPA